MRTFYIETSPGNFDAHTVEGNTELKYGDKNLYEAIAELEYLTWFKQTADFGPSDGDVHMLMDEQYEKETGNKVPTDWRTE